MAIVIESKLNEKNKHRVRVGRSYAGHGLFAQDAFKRGERIVEYVGYKITNAEAEEIKVNRYLFDLNSRYTIDGRPRFNIARYANHSCKPNAEAHDIGGRIFLVALKAIAPGDEITWDYGKEYFDEYIRKDSCLCTPCKDSRQMITV